MNEVLKKITEEEKQFLVIYEGELCYVYNKRVPNNKKKAELCESVGIKVLQGNETKWEDLKAAGYQVPEAFTFAEQELPGYWGMKYTAG